MHSNNNKIHFLLKAIFKNNFSKFPLKTDYNNISNKSVTNQLQSFYCPYNLHHYNYFIPALHCSTCGMSEGIKGISLMSV